MGKRETREPPRAGNGRRRLLAALCAVVGLLALCDAVMLGFGTARRTQAEARAEAQAETQESAALAAARSARQSTQGAVRETWFCTPETPSAHGSPWLLLVNKTNPIPDGYVLNLVQVGGSSAQMQAIPAEALERMLADGRAAGLDIVIRSAYRSNAEQTANFNRRKAAYLAQGLDEETAFEYTTASIMVPGCSEHETGLCSDIAASTTGTLGPAFGETDTGRWLAAHSTEYGFILRYPEGMQEVTGVYYEPWHFRYVGVEDAAKITAAGLTLEEYVANGSAHAMPKHGFKEKYEQN